jgi:hypothetical protein
MSRYTHFTKLKHHIFLNGGSRLYAARVVPLIPFKNNNGIIYVTKVAYIINKIFFRVVNLAKDNTHPIFIGGDFNLLRFQHEKSKADLIIIRLSYSMLSLMVWI